MTEAELAARLGRELGALAIDASWSAAATADQPEGHYSDAIADAKAALAIDGDLAAADLSAQDLGELRDRALMACLERLELHYSTLVDTSTGQGDTAQTQKLSQVRAGIVAMRIRLDSRVGSSARGVTIRGRARPDYTAAEGDEVVE